MPGYGNPLTRSGPLHRCVSDLRTRHRGVLGLLHRRFEMVQTEVHLGADDHPNDLNWLCVTLFVAETDPPYLTYCDFQILRDERLLIARHIGIGKQTSRSECRANQCHEA